MQWEKASTARHTAQQPPTTPRQHDVERERRKICEILIFAIFYPISFSPLAAPPFACCWWWWWCLLMQCSKSLAPMIYTSSQPTAKSRHDYYTMFAFGTMRKLAFSILYLFALLSHLRSLREALTWNARPTSFVEWRKWSLDYSTFSNSHLCVWFTTTATRRLTCAHQSRNSSCPECERD